MKNRLLNKYHRLKRHGYTDEDVYAAIKNDILPKYANMKQHKASPEEVYLAMKAELGFATESIRLFRELFSLSFDEYKQIAYRAENGGNDTLSEEAQAAIIDIAKQL